MRLCTWWTRVHGPVITDGWCVVDAAGEPRGREVAVGTSGDTADRGTRLDADADPVTDAVPPEGTDAEEAEIDAASRVTEADLDDAIATWRAHAPRAYRDLLDAE